MDNLSYELAITMLDEMDCVAMTDSTGRYIYKNKLWYERRLLLGQDPNVEYPWLLLKDSAVAEVLRTRKKVIGRLIKSGDTTICVNYYPITRGGQFFGVLIWTIFTGLGTVQEFVDQVGQLTQELKLAKKATRTLAAASYGISNIVGQSDTILLLKEQIAQVALTKSNVLIHGETGVGKELVAHAIHDLSNRKNKRFVRVNCSAIPKDLLEAEFFGYAPNSFTGAAREGKTGKFEAASGGSLFLDEINLLPIEMQPKLLRALQEHEIERIGTNYPIAIDARIMAATNADLNSLLSKGLFREDLYYRLNVINIVVPPLRERKEDIPILVRSMVSKLNYQLGFDITYVKDDVLAFLQKYSWPGNIRELQNVIEQAMSYAKEDTIELVHVERYFDNVKNSVPDRQPTLGTISDTLAKNKEKTERETIQTVLGKCGGNRSLAAKKLGIARSTFYRKTKLYNL